MSGNFDINQLIENLQGGEIEKQASEAEVVTTPSVADELRSVLLTKSASVANQEAGELGRLLAQRLMEKVASENNEVTEAVKGDNLSELTAHVEATLQKEASEVGEQPNVANANNAANAAEQQSVNATAEQSGGTVEAQTAESIQKGLNTPSATATSEDLVRKVEDQAEDANMQKAAAVDTLVGQGHSFFDAVGLVAMADSELQKEAAFAELTAEGYSFDEATDMIKAASEALFDSGSEEITKEAAMSDLMAQGVPFDEAVNMVKEAGLGNIGGALRGAAAKVGSAAKGAAAKASGASKNVTKKQAIVAGASAGAVAGGAYGAKKAMTKEAAMKDLMDEGYSYTQALAAVQA